MWVSTALQTGLLGAVALYVDHGHVATNPPVERIAHAVATRYGLRNTPTLDAALRTFRDAHYHELRPEDRVELLRCLQRHGNDDFRAMAVTYPALVREMSLRGGGGDNDDGATFDARFAAAFDPPTVEESTKVVRRLPTTFHTVPYAPRLTGGGDGARDDPRDNDDASSDASSDVDSQFPQKNT